MFYPCVIKNEGAELNEKKYTIKYKEELIGFFDVEADNEEQAEEEFWRLINRGEICFDRLEMSDSDVSIVYPSNNIHK